MSLSPSNGLLSNFSLSLIKRIPVPGLDVVIGVTAYQIAEAARVATLTAARGRKVTKKLVRALQDNLAMVWKDKTAAKEHGVEITRQAARGAMHVLDEKPLAVENLVGPVATSVVKASSKAGVNPLNGVHGASQGVVQGAIETSTDVTAAMRETT